MANLLFAYGPATSKTHGYGIGHWYEYPVLTPVADYSKEQVMAVLLSGTRNERYGCYLLDNNNIRLRELNMLNMDIQCLSGAAIQRSLAAEMLEQDAEGIDWGRHRLQPAYYIQMPDGGWHEEPLGVFVPTSPVRQLSETHAVYKVEGYDMPVILSDDKFDAVTAVRAGESYQTVIQQYIMQAGIQRVIFEPTDVLLSEDIFWEIGTSKLDACNQLLDAIGYAPVMADARGNIICKPYAMPYDRDIAHTYYDDQLSVMTPDATVTLDVYAAPNVFVAVASIPDGEALVSRFENTDPLSKTSIPARGRKIVSVVNVDNIADQDALDFYVRRLANKATARYGEIEFTTLNMPYHGISDVIFLSRDRGGIAGRYVESEWRMILSPGSVMTHRASKVVLI